MKRIYKFHCIWETLENEVLANYTGTMWFPSRHNFWHFEHHDDEGEKPNYNRFLSKHLHDIPGNFSMKKLLLFIIVIIIGDIIIILIISEATLH
jgi:hypothetical protein